MLRDSMRGILRSLALLDKSTNCQSLSLSLSLSHTHTHTHKHLVWTDSFGQFLSLSLSLALLSLSLFLSHAHAHTPCMDGFIRSVISTAVGHCERSRSSVTCIYIRSDRGVWFGVCLRAIKILRHPYLHPSPYTRCVA
jgi:hypothetical protein